MSDKKRYQVVLKSDIQKQAKIRAMEEDSNLSEAINILLSAWLNSGTPLAKVRRVANGGDDEKSD